MKNKEEQKEIAKKRIEKLFEEAEKTKSQKLANRYVELARKIAMKLNLRMPKKFKRKFCKHCYNYFKGKNYRVRTRDGKLIYYCFECKKYTRIPLS
ncbi:MAG: ribonuclease P [Nanoarchaeota archaeon]|nr:ribonuclease P [Nanoarchaeota archaeon]